MEVDFPYVPGLLAFRVGPAICRALDKFSADFDLLLFDGQGIAHPNGIGLASHIGVLYNKPSVGVTRNNLFGTVMDPPEGERNYTDITHPRSTKVLGYALSLGPTCSLTPLEAVQLIMQITREGSCFPGSLAKAHSVANKAARSHSRNI
jgi:deoxyribonuclease V